MNRRKGHVKRYVLYKIGMLILLFLSFHLAAQPRKTYQVNVNNITAQGLSNNIVHDVIQDDRGLLWFGTSNGLNRYTGYAFESFYKSQGGLSSNIVHDIHQAQNGNFWLATRNGIDIFDPITDSVKMSFNQNGADSLSLQSGIVERIYQNSDGKWWIIYVEGFIDIYSEENGFRKIHNPFSTGDSTFSKVYRIAEDTSGDIWIGTLKKGVFHIGQDGEVKNNYLADKAKISDLSISSTNAIWACVSKQGLFRKKEEQDTFQKVTLPDSLQDKGFSLANIEKYYAKGNGKFWLRDNKNNSFLYYDVNEQKIEDYTSSLGPFSKTTLYNFYPDQSNNLWVSSQDGLFKLTISKNRFRNFLAQPYPLEDFKNRVSTRDMLELQNGNIIIASYSGLYELDTHTCQTSWYRIVDSISNRPAFIPYELYQDSLGDFWIASEGEGLVHYRRDENEYDRYFTKSKSISEANKLFYAISMIRHTRGRFWIGSYDGLYYYEKGERYLKEYQPQNTTIDFGKRKIWSLNEDEEHFIWVGTNKGLIKLHPDTGVVEKYFSGKNGHGIRNNNIMSIHQDNGQMMWVGTRGDGLIRLNTKEKKWKVFNKEDDGLSSNVIYSIEEANDSTLWLSSDYGLMKFNKQKAFAKTFLPKNGLSHHEFNHASSLRTSDGQLYFGSVNGINLVLDHLSDIQTEHQPVQITELEVFDGDLERLVDKTSTVLQNNQVVLQPKVNFFKLTFTLTNYQNPEANRYKYKFAKNDEEWLHLGTQNHIRLHNLAYGTHLLKIQGANSHGTWSDKILEIELVVLKPFYLQWWFVALASIAFLLIGVFLVYVWSVRMQKFKLEKVVDEKTQELQTKLKELERSNKELEQYAYIVSHDLKSPLRTIASYTQMLEKKYKGQLDQHADTLIQFIVNGVHQMHYTIQDLLIYAQVGKKDEHFEKIDLNNVLHNAKETLQKEIEENNVQIDADELPTLLVNHPQMLQVFLNLISNAIKYSKQNTKPIVRISAEEKTDLWLFKVEDNGEGINENYHDMAFEPFQRIAHTERSGTGMGLAICKKVISLHKGEIWFHSRLKEGTTFYFTIAKNLSNNGS